MSYVLINLDADIHPTAPAARRAETPLAALRAYNAYTPEDCMVQIRDQDGEPVSLAQLLEDATRQAGDHEQRRELARVLADFIGADLYPWDDVPRLEFVPDSYWQLAGRHWVRAFGQLPPDDVVEELSQRHGSCDLLLESVRGELNRVRRAERVLRQPSASPSSPSSPPAYQQRSGRSLS
jgi:hypothetical protein